MSALVEMVPSPAERERLLGAGRRAVRFEPGLARAGADLGTGAAPSAAPAGLDRSAISARLRGLASEVGYDGLARLADGTERQQVSADVSAECLGCAFWFALAAALAAGGQLAAAAMALAVGLACMAVWCPETDYEVVPGESPTEWDDEVETVDCPDLDDCEPVVVAMAPSDSTDFVNEVPEDTDRYAYCGDFAEVQGLVFSKADAAARVGDLAQVNGEHYTWFSAPAALTTFWSSPNWAFDHPSCSWLYMAVGYDAANPLPSFLDCRPPVGFDRDFYPYSFAVSALMPYAAYEVVSVDEPVHEVDANRDGIPENTVACVRILRVRYWVGLMNHFSVFLTPDNTRNENPPDRRFTTADLPASAWDNTPGAVYDRGELATLYTQVMRSSRVTLSWEQGGRVRSSSRRYSCRPDEDLTAYGLSYRDGQGGPSPLCFSDPEVWEQDNGNDADGDTDRAGDMVSYLGNVVWGDACLVVPRSGYDYDATIKNGFEAVFGRHVKLTFTAAYYGPLGEGAGGANPDGGDHPIQIKRYFCLRARDLQRTWQVYDTVSKLRGTPEGAWLFRSFDAARLGDAASKGFDQELACEREHKF